MVIVESEVADLDQRKQGKYGVVPLFIVKCSFDMGLYVGFLYRCGFS